MFKNEPKGTILIQTTTQDRKCNSEVQHLPTIHRGQASIIHTYIQHPLIHTHTHTCVYTAIKLFCQKYFLLPMKPFMIFHTETSPRLVVSFVQLQHLYPPSTSYNNILEDLFTHIDFKPFENMEHCS